MASDPPITGIRPILTVVQSNGERLIVARLTNLGGGSQSNRFVLRQSDFRAPWTHPDKGYFGYAEVARALDANGWRGCKIEAMPTTDLEERRARLLARKKLHLQCVEAAIRRVQDDSARPA
ncbi:hypothetical protein [Azospirillum griseum]|uniref:Uncharacterized protein n=1 Tax=Azospirillum griseum TaxID=2496639 RepID=A0A3S0I0Z9_9PROT|nr:hypothetical protein [Azospirillum griseum]RTR20556.1 hypothetical protein EJ903_10560 [Azospirillum griseum]